MADVAQFEAYRAKARFGALDGLRFFCIAAVLIHHMPGVHEMGETYVLLSRGFLGVDFFFVLSGFLITTLLLREEERTGTISIRGFYWRRVLRILPLYLLVVTAMVVVYAVIKAEPLAQEIWPYYYVFLANFLQGDIANLGPMWSLSVEEQYYLIWPLLLILLPRRTRLWALAILVVINMAGVLDLFGVKAPQAGPLIFAMSIGYAAILLGSALAVILNDPRLFRFLAPVLGRRWSALPLIALLLVQLLVFPDVILGWPQFSIHVVMTLILATLVMREDHVAMPLLRFRPVARVGEVSYGVYLLHLIGLHIATESLPVFGLPQEGIGHFVIYLLASYLLAELSFRTYERYFLSLRHKPLGRLRKQRSGETLS